MDFILVCGTPITREIDRFVLRYLHDQCESWADFNVERCIKEYLKAHNEFIGDVKSSDKYMPILRERILQSYHLIKFLTTLYDNRRRILNAFNEDDSEDKKSN